MTKYNIEIMLPPMTHMTVALTIVATASHSHSVSGGYQRSEPNKMKYIEKHVCEGSNELAIHKYVQSGVVGAAELCANGFPKRGHTST